MAFGAGGGSPDEIKGDINVTPLVDVCLVLLIIFMVVTPMLQQGVDVLLPDGPHAEKKPGDKGDLIVSIKTDGSIFVDRTGSRTRTSPPICAPSTRRIRRARSCSRRTGASTSARCGWSCAPRTRRSSPAWRS